MSKFSSENALIDRLFLKNIPNRVVYDSEFVGATEDFQEFCKESIWNFLNYLSQNNSSPESAYTLQIGISTKFTFSKELWLQMLKIVFDGLICSVVLEKNVKNYILKVRFSQTFQETVYGVYI